MGRMCGQEERGKKQLGTLKFLDVSVCVKKKTTPQKNIFTQCIFPDVWNNKTPSLENPSTCESKQGGAFKVQQQMCNVSSRRFSLRAQQ